MSWRAAFLVVVASGCNGILGIQSATLRDAGTSDALDDTMSACGDVSNDSTNCGACGHDCLGAKCTGGKCVPTLLISRTNKPEIAGLASDGKRLFFAESATIYFCEVDKDCHGVPDPLFTAPASISSQLQIVGNQIFFGTSSPQGGVIYRTSSTPGDASVAYAVATSPQTPTSLADCGGRVCWTDYNPMDTSALVMSATKPSGQALTLLNVQASTFPGPGTITSDGTRVYAVVANNTMQASPTIGGAPVDVVYTLGVHGTAFYGDRLYWATNGTNKDGTIAWCDPNAPNMNPCYATLHFLARYQAAPWNIAVDGSGVYWTNAGDPGTVVRCPIQDTMCDPVELASEQSNPTQIALDDKRVYWLNSGTNQITWVAK